MTVTGEKTPSMIHGGNILAMARELGCDVADLIDMSSNLTPLGMVPGLKEAMLERFEEIRYLPETGSETLREIFASRYGLQKGQVLAGNGTTEFIYGIPEALNLKRAVIVNPTYGDYEPASMRAGMSVENFILSPREDFIIDFEKLERHLTGNDLVFLCNPNNPTGVLTATKSLYEFIANHPQTYFLVDESYLPFVREPSLLEFPLLGNLYILNSSSKVYGIPGLRLGFLGGMEKNLKLLAGQRKPWGVNRMAQIAGEFLLAHGDDYIEQVVRYVEEQRPLFVDKLARLSGVRVIPGAANFILSQLTGEMRADKLTDMMLTHKIMIRNCDTFTSLDNSYFRLSLKNIDENRRCLSALKEILGNK